MIFDITGICRGQVHKRKSPGKDQVGIKLQATSLKAEVCNLKLTTCNL
jgi:hypothetical protein